MAERVVINNVEFLVNETLKARFEVINNNTSNELKDAFIILRDPMRVSDSKFRDLIKNSTVFKVEYFNENDELFGSLTDGQFYDYKLDPDIERIRFAGNISLSAQN